MKQLISTLYIIFGLLIVTLTYFENYRGPGLITFLGVILFLFGLFRPYFNEFMKSHKEYWNESKKD